MHRKSRYDETSIDYDYVQILVNEILEYIEYKTEKMFIWQGYKREGPTPKEVAEIACTLRNRLYTSIRIEFIPEHPVGDDGDKITELIAHYHS